MIFQRSEKRRDSLKPGMQPLRPFQSARLACRRKFLVAQRPGGTASLHAGEDAFQTAPRIVTIDGVRIRHAFAVEQDDKRHTGRQEPLLQLAKGALARPFCFGIAEREIELDPNEVRGDFPDEFRFLQHLAIQKLATVAPSMARQKHKEILALRTCPALCFGKITNPSRTRMRSRGDNRVRGESCQKASGEKHSCKKRHCEHANPF